MFTELKLIQHKDVADKNEIRKNEQEWQYRYYSGDFFNIKLLLVKALERSYMSVDVEEMQLQIINITEKIINQMCVVYSDPAQRKIMIEGKENEELTKYYNSILPMDINTSDKQTHRLAKLHNTVLLHITFEKGRFKYTTLPSYIYDIKQENKTLIEVSYEKMFDDELYKVYWTDKEHYRRDTNDNKSNIPKGNERPVGNGKNPFEVMPFPVLRLKNCVDFWGEGQNDLANVNEQVNLLLTKLINSDVIMGTEGTVLGINLDLHKKGEEEEGEKKVRTGRRHPITVNNVKTDDVMPTLQHITSDPHIEDTMGAIDWYIRLIANFKGLNPNVVLSMVKDTSDYQKIMDAVEQMEIRKDDIEPCRIFEHDRFEITKTMNNALVGIEDGVKKIPEEATLMVDFADIEIQKTPKDLREERDWKLKHNLTTLIEILREENPDLNDEQATEILEENKTANSELGGTTSRLELLARNNLEQNQGEL